jgi:hypothetical protein
MSGVVGRTFCALARANVDTIATAHGASDCKFSFVVAKKDMQPALTAIHQEFRLGTLLSDAAAKSPFAPRPGSLTPSVESCSLSAD